MSGWKTWICAAILAAMLAPSCPVFAGVQTTTNGEAVSGALPVDVSMVQETEQHVPETGSQVQGDVQFLDISGHWAADVIQKYAANGYINGYPDGTFRPEDGVSAAEFCRIVSAIKGINYRVTTGNWSMPYIRIMMDEGVIGRNDFTDYDAKMTREQVAKAVLPLMTGEYYPKDMSVFAQYIADIGDADDSYREFVLKTYVSGVLSGYEDGAWGPKKGVTRAELLSILERVYNKDMRVIPDVLGNAADAAETSYYYSAAVQVRNTTNANTMQYRLYGSDAVYLEEDDAATGLKIANEIQGAQGFAMLLRYDVSELKERRSALDKLVLDVTWLKNGSKAHELGLWYYTYDTDKTDWNNPIYYRNVNNSAVAGDDKAGYNSVISNIKGILPTWGNASMAVPNEEKTAPIAKAARNDEGKFLIDLTAEIDAVLSHANENNMVEFVLTSVNYDGYLLDEDKPQIYIAGEKAPKLNAEYNTAGELEYGDISIDLTPADAVLNGGMLIIEETDGIENIAYFVEGQEILFNFEAPVEGDYLMKINSSASTSAGGIAKFTVNGTENDVEFPYGEGWSIYKYSDVMTVHLNKGANTLRITDVQLNATYLINIRNVVFELQ